MAWIHSILFLMESCNLVSEVKTWTSPHQVAVHLLQPRARVLQWFKACTSISSSVKALPWVLTNSTTASRSPSPEQIGWQRILAFPWGKSPWIFFYSVPFIFSSSVPPRLMSICQFYNIELTFGKIGTTNITFDFIFKCLRIFYKSSSDSDRIWFCVGADKYTSRPRTPSGNRSSLPELVALT